MADQITSNGKILVHASNGAAVTFGEEVRGYLVFGGTGPISPLALGDVTAERFGEQGDYYGVARKPADFGLAWTTIGNEKASS